ncbi:hypothetical protein F4782DRAFT_245524 [Xylaria castorea]|nr:hypothetical protein F4782DRAFT_245524 [Xylaria castorea]
MLLIMLLPGVPPAVGALFILFSTACVSYAITYTSKVPCSRRPHVSTCCEPGSIPREPDQWVHERTTEVRTSPPNRLQVYIAYDAPGTKVG